MHTERRHSDVQASKFHKNRKRRWHDNKSAKLNCNDLKRRTIYQYILPTGSTGPARFQLYAFSSYVTPIQSFESCLSGSNIIKLNELMVTLVWCLPDLHFVTGSQQLTLVTRKRGTYGHGS